MRAPSPVIVGLVALIALGVGGWQAARSMYLIPRAEREAALASAKAGVRDYAERVGRLRRGLDDRREALRSSSPGEEADVVELRIRRACLAMVASAGIAEDRSVRVDIGSPRRIRNPIPLVARSRLAEPARSVLSSLNHTIPAVSVTLRAEGGLGQVTELIAIAASQPWVHRVDAWSISPAARGDRVVYAAVVSFRTLMLGAGPADGEGLAVARADESVREVLGMLTSPNRFERPAPPPPPPVEDPTPETPVISPPETPAPPPLPWGSWRVLGVASSGALGPLVMVEHVPTRRTRWLSIGESVEVDNGVERREASFAGFGGGSPAEAVVFRIGEGAWLVGIGQRLSERRAVEGSSAAG